MPSSRNKIPNEVMAQAITEFERTRDWQAVAKRHGMSEKSLRRGLKRLAHDKLLAALVQEKANELDKVWSQEAVEFLALALRKAKELIRKAESVKDIRAVMGAIKIVGDLQTVREALNGQQPDTYQPRPKPTAAPGDAGSGATGTPTLN